MSAEVDPVGAGPLPVPAGTTGPPVPFTEHAGLDPATGRLVMYLRIAQNGEAGPPPGLRLTAGAGPPTDVGTAPTQVHDHDTLIALAIRTDEPDGVTLVEVEVLQPGRSWALQIVNSDTAADHSYAWVVADTDDGTRRPWLDLPTPELTFRTDVGETAEPQDLPVANHGPGPLTLDDPDGTELGSGFTLLAVTPRPIGANGGGSARIAFTTPALPVRLEIVHTFASNDIGTGATAGRNNRVVLRAVVSGEARWAAGDVLMLSEFMLARLDRATGQEIPVVADIFAAGDVVVDATTGDAVLVLSTGVTRVNRFTGARTPVPGPSTTRPDAIAVDRDGTVVVLDGAARVLVRIKPDGAQNVTGAQGLGNTSGMALEANGDAVVTCVRLGAEGLQASVRRIDHSGGMTIVAADGFLGTPARGSLPVVVERDGTILVAYQSQSFPGPFNAGSLIRIDPRSGQARRFVVDSGELSNPVSLAVAADGTIVVSTVIGLFAVHPQTGVLTRLSDRAITRIAVVPPLPE